jgi:hypothetical protein
MSPGLQSRDDKAAGTAVEFEVMMMHLHHHR